MSNDPEDDALRWDGDDEAVLARPVRVVRPPVSGPVPARAVGAPMLLALGLLAGVYLVETIGWARSVTGATLSSFLSTGSGSPVELVTYAINLAERAAALLAAPLWFALVLWRVGRPVQRLLWLVLGVAVLVPWPEFLHA